MKFSELKQHIAWTRNAAGMFQYHIDLSQAQVYEILNAYTFDEINEAMLTHQWQCLLLMCHSRKFSHFLKKLSPFVRENGITKRFSIAEIENDYSGLSLVAASISQEDFDYILKHIDFFALTTCFGEVEQNGNFELINKIPISTLVQTTYKNELRDLFSEMQIYISKPRTSWPVLSERFLLYIEELIFSYPLRAVGAQWQGVNESLVMKEEKLKKLGRFIDKLILRNKKVETQDRLLAIRARIEILLAEEKYIRNACVFYSKISRPDSLYHQDILLMVDFLYQFPTFFPTLYPDQCREKAIDLAFFVAMEEGEEAIQALDFLEPRLLIAIDSDGDISLTNSIEERKLRLATYRLTYYLNYLFSELKTVYQETFFNKSGFSGIFASVASSSLPCLFKSKTISARDNVLIQELLITQKSITDERLMSLKLSLEVYKASEEIAKSPFKEIFEKIYHIIDNIFYYRKNEPPGLSA